MTKSITSIAHIEPAIKELKEIDLQIREAQAANADEVAKLQTAFDKAHSAKITRRGELEDMISTYVDRNKSVVFANGAKSCEFPSGTISIRLGPLAISLRKGVLVSAVAGIAEKLKLSHIIRTVQELDKNEVKSLIKNGLLDDEKLTELGIVKSQSETINIKLNDA